MSDYSENDTKRSAGLRPAGTPAPVPAVRPTFYKFIPSNAIIRSRGYIPHIEAPGAVYFITFHLADAVPQPLIIRLESERRIALERLNQSYSRNDPDRIAMSRKIYIRFSRKIESCLDTGRGACWLNTADIADVVAGTLQNFNGERYRLSAWCVMPNHVHVVCTLEEGYGLDKVLHSWKSYTAQKANKVLGRKGTFWAREYFDQIVRSEEQYERCLEYVLNNPVKAGLKDWKWVWMVDE
jgi:REP element-mobilizing transposase RayT